MRTDFLRSGGAALALLVLPASAALCAVAGAPSAAGAAAGQVLRVGANTQAESGDLRIGLAYVRPAQYTDEAGAKRRGLVASLWIYVRGDKAKSRKLTVHKGQSVELAGYTLFVEEILAGPGFVRLRVQEPAKPSAPPK